MSLAEKKSFGNGFVDFSLQNTNLLLVNLPVYGISRCRIISNWTSLILQPAQQKWIAFISPITATFLIEVSFASLLLTIIPFQPQRLPQAKNELHLLLAYTHWINSVSFCIACKKIYPCYQVYLRTISRPVIPEGKTIFFFWQSHSFVWLTMQRWNITAQLFCAVVFLFLNP